jgi:hypothetical protein
MIGSRISNATAKLQALGYGDSSAEIRRFQQDFNRMDPDQPIAVTGELDRATATALSIAYDSRALMSFARERGER